MPRPLPGISPRAWEHPADAAALAALRKVPGFDMVVMKTFGRLNEWSAMRQVHKKGARVDADHHPGVHRLYTGVLETLDAPEEFPLYVVEMPVINAATMGMEAPVITLADKAVEQLSDTQVRVILAHETGHILSGHMLYKTMLRLGIYMGWAALSFPVSAPVIAGVMAGLLEWDRKSELSADRASLLALQDLDAVVGTLRSVQSRHDEAMDEGREDVGLSEEAWRRLQGFVKVVHEAVSRHPPVDRRIEELAAWVASGEYARILDGDYPVRGEEPPDPTWEKLRAGAGVLTGELKHQAEVLGGGLKELGEPVGDWLGEAAGRVGQWLKKD